MKTKCRFFKNVSVAGLALSAMCFGGLLVTGCVNDPEYIVPENLKPAENPFGDLTVPNGFDWATTYTLTVKVNVNDEYKDGFYFVVELWDANPIGNNEANMLSKGVARYDLPYESSFSVPAGLTDIFVAQTDPRGRTVVRSYPISKTDNVLECDFSSSSIASKRAISILSDQVPLPNYRSVPAEAIEISEQLRKPDPDNALQNGGVYKITGEYTGTFTHWGVVSAQLYVEGVWNVPADFKINTGLEVIVLPGAKINAANLEFVGTSQLDIMPGASVEMNKLDIANTGKFYNMGTFKAKEIGNNPGLLYNAENAQMNVDNFQPGGSTVYNYGTMTFGRFESKWAAVFYNNCLVTVTSDFIYQEGTLVLNQGSVIAKNMAFNGNTISMNNGSMLSASESINMNSGTVFDGGNSGNRSLLQSPEFFASNGIVFKGSLTVEVDKYDAGNQWYSMYKLESPAEITGYKQSALTINTCGTTTNEGNEGTDPSNPQWPIIINDATTYSYAFEDNWPVYGDYDMNDVVIYITNRQITKQESGVITSYKVQGRLMAVGASKKIAAAVRFANLPASSVGTVVLSNAGEVGMNTSFFELTGTNIEKGQANIVVPLFSEAHKFIGSTGLINTLLNVSAVAPKDFEFEVQFDAAKSIKESDLDMAYFDLFLITDEKSLDRQEVHLPVYNPTDRANLRLVGTGNCKDSAAPYLSTDGLSFGLMVPYAFRWPVEYAPIKGVYADFASWVRSSGKENMDWYLNASDHNRVYPVIE